jgi:Sec-independent protein translocase protein TatA
VGGLDPAKILVILIIALVVLGPERLPGAARQLGGAWRELNKLREKFEEEVRAAVPDLDLPKIPTSPSRAVSGYLTGLVSGLGDTSVGDAAAGGGSVTEPGADVLTSGASGAGAWSDDGEGEEVSSTWRPLLESSEPGATGARRAPSVPSWSSAGSLAADTVFVLDEPSMN